MLAYYYVSKNPGGDCLAKCDLCSNDGAATLYPVETPHIAPNSFKHFCYNCLKFAAKSFEEIEK
jgi:hypothetical protein